MRTAGSLRKSFCPSSVSPVVGVWFLLLRDDPPNHTLAWGVCFSNDVLLESASHDGTIYIIGEQSREWPNPQVAKSSMCPSILPSQSIGILYSAVQTGKLE